MEAIETAAVSVLRRTRPWSNLAEESLEAIASAMEAVDFPAGETIIRQGQPAPCFYILASGRFEVKVRTEGGTQVTVATLREGDCVGEMSLLTGDPASADVVCAERCEILLLDRATFDELTEAHPQLLREFVKILSQRLRATDVVVGAAKEDENALASFFRDEKADHYGDLIGKHPGVSALNKAIEKLGKTDAAALVVGESGTGKETVARLVHTRGERREGPLVIAECGQISETPWGDKLFGTYRSGASKPSSRDVCYAALAKGGTIVLTDIDLLPMGIQARLARFIKDGSVARPDIRFLATSRLTPEQMQASGHFDPELEKLLAANVLKVPPLRDRKRDIADLARHFVRRHAQRLGKPAEALSDKALTKLVSYDFRVANVQELKEVLERAVMLADEKTIGADAIFLRLPQRVERRGFNLLSLRTELVRAGLGLLPRVLRPVVALFFAFLVFQCFWEGAYGGAIATTLVWAVWWPMLALSFFFVGRAWCSVCPMASAGQLVQKFAGLQKRIPDWMKEYDVYLALAGFALIIWVEEAAAMRHSPLATGFLLLSIAAGAVTASVLFPRRSWCRHLCPLGNLAGVCSSSALVELRPSMDICSAKCQGHSCYKGDEKVEGCPVFNHVMFVDTNQNCVLCMNCVSSCSNGSPQFNLRLPGIELWSRAEAEGGVGRFITAMLGLLPVLAVVQLWDGGSGAGAAFFASHRIVMLTVLMAAGMGLPLLAQRLVVLRRRNPQDSRVEELFWRRVLCWAPLVTAGFCCYQIAYLPGLDSVQAGLTLGSGPSALWIPLLSILRVGIMGAGLLTSAAGFWYLPNERRKGARRLRGYARDLFWSGAYATALTLVMVSPSWIGF